MDPAVRDRSTRHRRLVRPAHPASPTLNPRPPGSAGSSPLPTDPLNPEPVQARRPPCRTWTVHKAGVHGPDPHASGTPASPSRDGPAGFGPQETETGLSAPVLLVADQHPAAVATIVAGLPASQGSRAGVVEHSVYVHPAARGRGVGSALLAVLIASTEAAGIWTIHSGVFPENTASLALHARAGFRVIGTRERIGRHHGVWRDVVLIERRSPVIS
ncbi:N-acetyltransferase family protein [Streptosporangium sp. NPDC001681]|uniref:GNAT family N-acetyltransferase n=1 Tax=Streptosporangium sp. NPDC001681 TaxID=3154395 RepID=UPI00332B9AB0